MMNASNRNFPLLRALFCGAILALLGTASGSAAGMIGYWESYGNGIHLAACSTDYDVIAVGFAVPDASDHATITFAPSVESSHQVTADVRKVHKKGQRVVLSIGGEDAPNLELPNGAAVKKFQKSVENLIKKYGFDGIDLDLENATLSLQSGDNDFMHPTTPTIVNLIKGCKALAKKYGAGFMITMAPETVNIDAYGNYSGQYGSYLPVIYALGDDLTYVATQCYNSGSQYGRDGGVYDQATPDFCVAMADLLLGGYQLANGQHFPALNADQVAFGIPATAAAAPGGGYLAPSQVLKAAEYIGSGTTYSGRQYTLSNPAGYPNFAGVMCFDIDYDQANGLAMASTLDPYLHSIGNDAADPSE